MDLCKKSAQLLLNANSAKITPMDTKLIDSVKSELSRIRSQAKFLLAEQNSMAMQLNFLNDQLNIAYDPTSHIEARLFEIFNLNEPETFCPLMLSFLESFQHACQSQVTKMYIQNFILAFPKTFVGNNENITEIDTTYALDDGIDELIYILAKQKNNQAECEKLFEYYSAQLDKLSEQPEFSSENRQDKIAIKALTKSTQKLSKKIKTCQNKLLKLYQEVTDYKNKHHISFEIDPSFNLTKILQSTETQITEILFINNKNETQSTPYKVCENAPIGFICAGNFGKIKICQNINTKTLHAIVIQEGVLTSTLTTTDLNLDYQRPFSGNLNSLLSGVDLDEHIEKRRQPSIENRLNIARQAALILDKVNKQHLQIAIEITPVNFIWDDIKKQLYFCYLIPNPAIALNNTNPLALSNTLGKICFALFEAVEHLPQVIRKLIDDLLSLNKTQSLDLKKIANQLDDLFIHPDTYLKNGN